MTRPNYPGPGELPFPAYSYLDAAAEEAREASRRFWQGKPSYPTKWRIPLADDPRQRLAASLKRHHGDAR